MFLKKELIQFPIKRPLLSLLMGGILLFSFLPFMLRIELDFSAQAWLSVDDPHIERLSLFERTFGNDERLILLLELKEGEIFDSEMVQLLSELTEKLWTVPEILRVESLANFHWSYAEGDDLTTEPFLPEDMISSEEFLKQRRLDAIDHRFLPGVFFSKNLKSALVIGRIAFHPDRSSDFKKIALAAEDLTKAYADDPRFKIHLLGEPILSHNFQVISFRDLGAMTPLLLLLVIFYLAYSFRTVIGVVIPLGIIFASIGFTLGLTGLLGIKVNSLTFILPSVLMAIAIADSVHLLATFFNLHTKGASLIEAAEKAMEKNLYPIFLTSISTAIGFLSLFSSSIIPVKELGILAAAGTMAAMFFSYFFVIPLLLIFMNQRTKRHGTTVNQRVLSRSQVERYLTWVDRFKAHILVLSLLISVAATVLGLMNSIDSNPFKYFQDGEDISIANNYSLENYGGVGGPEILIDSGEKEGIKDPEFLAKVESFQAWLVGLDYVNNVVSVVNILKEMNQALYGGDPSEYRINTQRDVIAQELFLYTLGLPQGLDLNNQVDLENRRIRLSVMWEIQDSSESLKKIALIEDEAHRRGLDLIVTGKAILFQRMNGYVVMTFFTSIAFALLLITIILIVVFRSVKLGLLSLIPNFVPIILGAALLTILKIPIDIGCAIVASVTLGIAVDDTIHYLSHYNRLIKAGMARFEALVEVMATTGLALIITTVILVSCFGIFIFASLTPNIHFGLLCGFVITLALVCDLVILPAILLSIKEKKVLPGS